MGMLEGLKKFFGVGRGASSHDERLRRANQLMHQGDFSHAKTAFQEILAGDPTNREALIPLGRTLLSLGEYEAAVSVYKGLLAREDLSGEDRAILEAHLGDAHGAMGQHNEAVAAYDRALALNPKMGLAHMNVGAIHFNEGRLDKAIAHYTKALELLPNEPVLHTNLGKAYVGQGRFDEAIKEFEKALKVNENDPITYCELGNAHYYQGNLIEAIIKFKHAIALGPEYPDPHYFLGMIYEAQNNPQEATRFYLKYLKLEPQGLYAKDASGALKRMGRSV